MKSVNSHLTCSSAIADMKHRPFPGLKPPPLLLLPMPLGPTGKGPSAPPPPLLALPAAGAQASYPTGRPPAAVKAATDGPCMLVAAAAGGKCHADAADSAG
jgi:hypothetical protein